MKNKKAFTLVELLIVIFLLTIMTTIWFISYLKFLRDWRDTERIDTMTNITQLLELELTKNWSYPDPDDSTNIYYSWSLLWAQWTFWDTIYDSIQDLEKKPLDPLTWDFYAYSVTNIWDAYEIWWIQEVDKKLYINNLFIDKTYADDTIDITALVMWTYNKKVISTITTSLTNTWFVFISPSIISSDLSSTAILDILTSQKLVYTWYNNAPANFSSIDIDLNWWFDFTPNNSIVFSWSYELLKNNLLNRLELLENIQNAFSGTILENETWKIRTVNIDLNNPSDEVKELSKMVVENYLNKTVIK